MRKLLLVALFWSCAAFGAQITPTYDRDWVPSFSAEGDTDQYGYYMNRGMSYNWVDISGIGTEVTGLYDDNCVGPFDIGFEFPYYWYRATKFWVNSNGAISFSSGAPFMPQNNACYLPNMQAPNDLIAPLGADLTFDGFPNAKCYYYTNNTDTLIVSFHEVAAWLDPTPGGAHTFQLILVASDSTIVFHYGDQQGTFYDSTTVAGIENVSGQVGLEYFKKVDPVFGDAVEFIPPLSTTYEFKDPGMYATLSENNKGIFVLRDHSRAMTVAVKNYGTVSIPALSVELKVRDEGWVTHRCDTVGMTDLAVGGTAVATFDDWTPTVCGRYTVIGKIIYASDQNPGNNKAEVQVTVMTYPGWLSYDSNPTGASGGGWASGGGGWGQEFEPPVYPTAVESISVCLGTDTTVLGIVDSVDFQLFFMDDDGAGGGPGTILYGDTVRIDVALGFRWFVLPIPTPVDTIKDGKFYVGIVRMPTDTIILQMMENVRPFSRRGWENTGSWAPSRSREEVEFLIRAYARNDDYGIEATLPDERVFSLYQNAPNPGFGKTAIKFSLNKQTRVALKIYNTCGQLVRTLVDKNMKPGMKSTTWDGRNGNGRVVPAGIYFYELEAKGLKQTRKLVMIR